MKIVIVSAYGLPHMGGIEVAVDSLATELAGRGHYVTHVTSSAGPETAEPSRNYTQIRVAALNPLETRLGVPYPLFGPGLVTHLRREIAQADIVHTHGYIYPGTVVAAAVAPRTTPPTPFVLTEHVGHVPYNSSLLDRIEKTAIRAVGLRVLRRADAVIAYNGRVADQLIELCPSVAPRTILNGVDTERFRPPDEAERSRLRAELGWGNGRRVLFVGRPVAKKGFTEAVRAVAESGLTGVELVVVGADSLPAGTPGQVTPLGWLSRERLAELYRACDAMIAPARGEGFPLAAQEALASGLPLVLADDPGYAPSLDGSGAGTRRVGDPSGFAAALADLLGDQTSWKRAAGPRRPMLEKLFPGPAPQTSTSPCTWGF